MQLRVHQNGKRSELHRNSLIFIFQGSKSNALYDFHWQTAMLYFSLFPPQSRCTARFSVEVNRSSRPGRM
jgi:hypothetical protein